MGNFLYKVFSIVDGVSAIAATYILAAVVFSLPIPEWVIWIGAAHLLVVAVKLASLVFIGALAVAGQQARK